RDPRVTVVERVQSVEEMWDGADAAVEGGVRLVGVGVAVTDGDDDPPRDEQVDELERSGQLGRERVQPDRAGREEALEQADVRVTPCRGRMRPEPLGRQE